MVTRPKMLCNLEYFKTELETEGGDMPETKGPWKSCSRQRCVQCSVLMNFHLNLQELFHNAKYEIPAYLSLRHYH